MQEVTEWSAFRWKTKVLREEGGRAMESSETSSQSILRDWYNTENRTPQTHYVNKAFMALAIATVATVVSSIPHFCCKRLFNVDKAAGVPQQTITVTTYCVKKNMPLKIYQAAVS
jgi:hypothetical protein